MRNILSFLISIVSLTLWTDGIYGEDKKSIFEFGYEISHIKYEEPDIMRQEGIMHGIKGSYTWTDSFFLKVEGRVSYGKVDYSSPISGTMDNIDDYLVEMRLTGGYDIKLLTGLSLIPYGGIGYRYLLDDSSGMVTSEGDYGYRRESNYLYIPLGINLTREFSGRWSLGLTGEYDLFITGRQVSHLSDVHPGYNDIVNKQKSGYGLRASMELKKRFKSIGIALSPFIRYWNIDESEHADLKWYGTKIGEAWEPKNNSMEYGLGIILIF